MHQSLRPPVPLPSHPLIAQYHPSLHVHICPDVQLCTSEIAAHLELGAPENFRYLRESGCVSVPGLDDRKDFMEVEEVGTSYGIRYSLR